MRKKEAQDIHQAKDTRVCINPRLLRKVGKNRISCILSYERVLSFTYFIILRTPFGDKINLSYCNKDPNKT